MNSFAPNSLCLKFSIKILSVGLLISCLEDSLATPSERLGPIDWLGDWKDRHSPSSPPVDAAAPPPITRRDRAKAEGD